MCIPEKSESAVSIRSATTDLSRLFVLIVDDDSDSLEVATFALEQAGAQVAAVRSGAEALRSLSKQVPDLIISDVGMPEMDGYMLMSHIRQLPDSNGGAVPAIALTAYTDSGDHQKALDAGFQVHLAKPVDLDVLVRTAVELLMG